MASGDLPSSLQGGPGSAPEVSAAPEGGKSEEEAPKATVPSVPDSTEAEPNQAPQTTEE